MNPKKYFLMTLIFTCFYTANVNPCCHEFIEETNLPVENKYDIAFTGIDEITLVEKQTRKITRVPLIAGQPPLTTQCPSLFAPSSWPPEIIDKIVPLPNSRFIYTQKPHSQKDCTYLGYIDWAQQKLVNMPICVDITEITTSRDFRYLICGTNDGRIIIFDINEISESQQRTSWLLKTNINEEIQHLKVSPDNQSLVVASQKIMVVFRLDLLIQHRVQAEATSKLDFNHLTKEYENVKIASIDISMDNQILIAISNPNSLLISNINKPKVTTFSDEDAFAEIDRVKFSPDNTWILVKEKIPHPMATHVIERNAVKILDRYGNIKFEIKAEKNVRIISTQIDDSNMLYLVVQTPKQAHCGTFKTYAIKIYLDLENLSPQKTLDKQLGIKTSLQRPKINFFLSGEYFNTSYECAPIILRKPNELPRHFYHLIRPSTQ